ncbi:MAG: thioredoxin family protein [Armatimonadetes bacterium]|nr:thioredoxin family protein [Armatimonadota bacterium]
MVIKVYVACCGADKAIAAVEEAVKQAGVEARVEIVKDFAEIAKAGIMSTPAIKIDDQLVASGRVPKIPDLVSRMIDAASRA